MCMRVCLSQNASKQNIFDVFDNIHEYTYLDKIIPSNNVCRQQTASIAPHMLHKN